MTYPDTYTEDDDVRAYVTELVAEKRRLNDLDHQAKVLEELDRLKVRDEALRQFKVQQHPPAPLPEILTLKERLDRPVPELAWRVEGWQPANTRVMLAAQFKAGKTTLTGNLARCLVDGDRWLGTEEVNPVNRVTILDFEMGERQIDAWLRDQGIFNTDRIVVVPMRGRAAAFNILDEDTRARWAQLLAGTDYLIVDCLRPILDAIGLDEHRDGGRFLTAFDALCEEADIPDALMVHHMGHSEERSRGDSRFRDWPDVEWRLVREGDEPNSPRYISAYGRDVDQTESQLDHDPDTRHLTLVGGTRANAKARAALPDILDCLARSDEPLSTRAIIDALTDTDHTRRAITKGLIIGIHAGHIYTEKGARGAHLHSLTAPARRTAPTARRDTPHDRASAYMTGAVVHSPETEWTAPLDLDPEDIAR